MSHQHKHKKTINDKRNSYSSSKFDSSNEDINYDSSNSECCSKKRKHKHHEQITGEFKKIKPPTFNGKSEKGETTEAWLSGMKK